MAVSALVLIVLAIPLMQTLHRAVTQIGLHTEIQNMIERAFKTNHSTITDFSYAQAGKSLQVDLTLRTTQYFDNAQIEVAQGALRKRFGPHAQLMVNQILVAQGGLTAQQMARIKDFISGGVVQPVPKEEPFDLKEAQQRITSYLQKQVDEVLMGTTIRRVEPIQTELAADSPVVLNLRLIAPEPLAGQTVKLLASQLSTKVSSPVEIHGEIELEGSGYTSVVEVPDTRARPAQRDHLMLTELVATLLKRPDLQVRASMGGEDLEPAAIKASRLWREVHDVLNRSRLMASQWSLQLTPVAPAAHVEATPSKTAPPVPAAKRSVPPELRRAVRCDFRVYQLF
jgi:hypothetical protein